MELIKHECGIAMIRLLKPLEYYKEKYGSELYALNKLYLMMEKEHNRGQEGAGIGSVKLDVSPGREYIFRERAEGSDAIQKIFASVRKQIEENSNSSDRQTPFVGEVYMGHLRYSTTGRSGLSFVHPFMRRNNWSARNLLLCGNFNMTNVDEIFKDITSTGQHPRLYADTFLLLEQLGHALDRENERLFNKHRDDDLRGLNLSEAIARDIDVSNILRRCAPTWDGGYVICGIIGNGDMFAMRDPHGIRPCFYYADDEIMVIASERPVIQTAFNLKVHQVKELTPGSAIIVDKDGSWHIEEIIPEGKNCRCSFERIYFSRGSDIDIYKERKDLGRELVDSVMNAIGYDIDNTVFSFIPNTAEVAFYGLTEEFEKRLIAQKIGKLQQLAEENRMSPLAIEEVLKHRVRREKVAIKDIKLRTFIAEGESRDDLAAHVYDITYGTINPGVDTLVAIDDSIVRGTTLKQSIIRILDRLEPKKIVIVSSSPQVRYPDCYGIDMSRMGEFIAFKAAIELLKESGRQYIIDEVYSKCKAQVGLKKEDVVNYVKEIYAPFRVEEISKKIVEMLIPEGTNAEVEIVYQTIEGMHKAIPNHPGDWYFSGDYPTPGGNRLVNQAFINFYEGQDTKRV
ncbi:MAG: amidophosphoribosyltransferase [Prevotella sp.]|nr:amidophosphoribosyltransferase [Bacteroides sp.]MCM1366730.1 amidophosphoribosyltransferase [Prevotella sp.]MCM1437032.1 amidophosphoribosyltransferase [Prevotella sp.]